MRSGTCRMLKFSTNVDVPFPIATNFITRKELEAIANEKDN